MLSWKNTPSLQKCLFYVPRNSLLLLWKEKLLKKKKRQLLSHCLHQRSLCHHSQITKRHRHCEAPAIPLAEQQPKPYWDSRGRGRLTAVEKGCELCSPSLSHRISTSLPGTAKFSHYYNHQVLLFHPQVLPKSSASERQTQRRNVNTEPVFYALRMPHLATCVA